MIQGLQFQIENPKISKKNPKMKKIKFLFSSNSCKYEMIFSHFTWHFIIHYLNYFKVRKLFQGAQIWIIDIFSARLQRNVRF